MIAVECACGRTVEVPDHVAGERATCPYCNRSLSVPGSGSQFGGRAEESSVAELIKDATSEPSLAPVDSEWRAAQRYKHVPGFLVFAAWAGIVAAIARDREAFYGVIGANPDWPSWALIAWLAVTLFFGVAACMGTVSAAYYRYTRRPYTEDRIGFAKAGGYDIGSWAPLASYVAVFAVYWATNPGEGDDPISFLRDPWLFTLVGAVLAHLVSGITASFVFRARFGAAGAKPWAGSLKGFASFRRWRKLRRAERLAREGKRGAALKLLEEAARTAREDRAREQLLVCLEAQVEILWDRGRGDLDAAMVRLKESEGIVRGMDKPDLLARCLNQQAVMLMDGGDLDGAMAVHGEIERFFRETDDHRGVSISLANQAKGLAEHGRAGEALPLIEEAHDLVTENGPAELADQVEAIRRYVQQQL